MDGLSKLKALIPEDPKDCKIPGWCTNAKAICLYDLGLKVHNGNNKPLGVEIGVWGGRSLISIALAFKGMGKGFILGIDPYSPDAATEGESGKNMEWWTDPRINYSKRHLDCLALITNLELGSHCALIKARAENIHTFVSDIDYLHIDGNHSDIVSTRDVHQWLSKVRVGGYIVLDDANWGSIKVARSLLSYSCELVQSGPKSAWEVWQKFS